MKNTRFKVLRAGPLVTYQDGGRPGNMRFGVTESGPMDRISHASANASVGNPLSTTAIEISLSGMDLECLSGATTLSVIGGEFQVEKSGEKFKSGTVFTIEAGEVLYISPGKTGNWCYLAARGKIETSTWLGHSATHALSGRGGGLIKSGQEFEVSGTSVIEDNAKCIPQFHARSFGEHLRVVMGPQEQHFSAETIRKFYSTPYVLTDSYDRMGVRLNGEKLEIDGALSIPSEPILRGSIQVSGDGVPTILMADHQTTGGYPKIATVISADQDNLSQLRPRNRIRFHPISCDNAIMLARIRSIETNSYFQQFG